MDKPRTELQISHARSDRVVGASSNPDSAPRGTKKQNIIGIDDGGIRHRALLFPNWTAIKFLELMRAGIHVAETAHDSKDSDANRSAVELIVGIKTSDAFFNSNRPVYTNITVIFDFALPRVRRCSLSRIISVRSAAGRISNVVAFTPGCFDINWIA
jgi:hypothetical protein